MSRLFYSTNGTVTIIEEKPVEAFSKIANYDNNKNNCYRDIGNILLPNKVEISGTKSEMGCINSASQKYNTIGYQSTEKMCWGANYTNNDSTYKNFVDNKAVDCGANTMNIYQRIETDNKSNISETDLKQMEDDYNRRTSEYEITKTPTPTLPTQTPTLPTQTPTPQQTQAPTQTPTPQQTQAPQQLPQFCVLL
jgi:hypothetical protein